MEDGKSPSNRAWGGKEGKNGGGKGNILPSYSSHSCILLAALLPPEPDDDDDDDDDEDELLLSPSPWSLSNHHWHP